MSDNTGNSCGGTSVEVVLFVVFLVLKLCGVIDWSWWWVTSPLWIGVGLGIFIYVFAWVLKH